MSSVGPSIAVVTGRPEEEVREILPKAGLRVAIVTAVDNEGLKIRVGEPGVRPAAPGSKSSPFNLR